MAGEVVIIGAGIVGCSAAYFLARAGVSVTVLDAVGIAAGASGRNNGLIEHPYDPATVGLHQETIEILQHVLGTAMPAAPLGTMLLARDEAAARDLARHYEGFPELEPQLLTPEQASAAEPLLAPGLWAVMLRTGYPIRPLEATTAFADLARQEGVRFELGEPLELVRERDQIVGVRSGGAQRLADVVLVAAGAGSQDLLAGVIPDGTVAPLWGVIVTVDLPKRPRHPLIEGALAAQHGGSAVAVEAPFTLLDSPSWLAVGSTMLSGPEPDGAAWTSRLLRGGTQFVPSIAEAQVHDTLVGPRPRSFDNRPILGRVPGQERLWIATGHGGRGMSHGAASARLLAAAIQAGDDATIPAELGAARLEAAVAASAAGA